MPISFVASTSTGLGSVVNVAPPATDFGVQFDGESTAVSWLLKGSINGTDFVNIAAASTEGVAVALASTQGPMAFVRLDVTVNGSTSKVGGWVTALAARAK